MFRSCFFALLLYAAIATGYWFWLDTVFETPGSYWGAAGLGLVVFLCLGALINAKTAWSDWSLASAARSHTPPRDGRMMAACGPIQPVDKPLLAPFSNMPCCLVEYDLSQESKSFSSDSDAKTGSDLAGFLMTPSEVQTGAGNVRLLGFPILEEGSSYTLQSFTAARRARDFVSRTQFEDISGLRLVNVFSAIQDAWTDEDGHVEKNLQLKKVDPQALFPDDLEAVWQEVYGEQPVDEPDAELGKSEDELLDEEELEDELDDEDEDDLDDDDGPPLPNIPIPTLKENRVSPGDQVCVIGRYDEMRRGIKPTGSGMQALRLIRGSIETLERKASSSLWSHLLGGIFFLILAHAATCFVMWAYLNNDKNLQKRTNEAFQAARDKNVPKLERLVKRGLDINVRNSDERTLLMETRDPEVVDWLIRQKIDLNAVDKYNYTALKWAVTSDQIQPKQQLDIVKLLVEAGADLNIRDKTGKTALMEADEQEKEEVANLLRSAGAVDDRITAENSDPLPEDGGEQLAVVKQYVSSIFKQDAATLRDTLTSPFTYEADEKLWKGWQSKVFEPFEKFEGYTRGDNAIVIVYGKSKLFDNANAKMTFQLRRLNGQWKVADKELDIN
jgi:hypothetical protein